MDAKSWYARHRRLGWRDVGHCDSSSGGLLLVVWVRELELAFVGVAEEKSGDGGGVANDDLAKVAGAIL